MVRIEQIEVVIADIPTVRPHVLAMTTMHSQAVVLVFLRRSDGIFGVGEATTIGGLAYGEESPESIKVNIETYFAPILQSCDADDVAACMALLSGHIVGNRFAKCAIETALLDGLGQARGLPVSELLGGRRVDRLEVAWTLASGDTALDIEEGQRVFEARRHRHFKLKIGKRDVEADCAHVGAIAKAFEGKASVRVDVNQAWSRGQAAKGAAMLQDAGVVLIEQPLAKSDFESGGLVPTAEVAVIAREANIALYGGTMLEGGIGTAASAHLFACLPDLVWHTELFGPLLMTEEFLTEPLVYRDFGLVVPDGPGLGVRVDRGKLELFRRH